MFSNLIITMISPNMSQCQFETKTSRLQFPFIDTFASKQLGIIKLIFMIYNYERTNLIIFTRTMPSYTILAQPPQTMQNCSRIYATDSIFIRQLVGTVNKLWSTALLIYERPDQIQILLFKLFRVYYGFDN